MNVSSVKFELLLRLDVTEAKRLKELLEVYLEASLKTYLREYPYLSDLAVNLHGELKRELLEGI